MPIVPLVEAAEQTIDLDGNPANGEESRVVTKVLQSFPVEIENVVFNETGGKSFTFEWPGAGPGGFTSFVPAGPDVGVKWQWSTVSQVYSIVSPVEFAPSRGVQVFGSPPAGVQTVGGNDGSFMVPGKSIFPSQVTVSSATLTSSLVTFFSPEQEIATCGGTFEPGRYEQRIANNSGETVTFTVEQPDCCPQAKMTICEDGCQFYLTDENNCGGCGIECAFDEFCDAGACEPICPAGQILCGEICVDPVNDPVNCGACGAECAFDEFCDAGACAPICPGQTLCGENCVDLASDNLNCGACDNPCDPLYICADGICVPNCPPGQVLCGEDCIDLLTDVRHCGACDAPCAYDEFCDLGSCAPICPGQTLCGETCVDLASDNLNCGACGNACDPLYICVDGTCVPDCPAGQVLCGEDCIDLLTDASHCGACGVQCAFDEFCDQGICAPICPGQTLCGETCVDLQNDPLNCGACGNACAPNDVCSGGTCDPCSPPLQTNCDNVCVNVHKDPFNCGECGFVCDFSDCPSTGTGACSMGSSCVCDSAGGGGTSDQPLFFSPTPMERPTRLKAATARREINVKPEARRRTERQPARARTTTTSATRALDSLEAPVCDVQPVIQTIPDGETFTQCTNGALAGKEVLLTATVNMDGKIVGRGPCAVIVPDPDAVITPFFPTPTAVVIRDFSRDGMLQPGETADVFITVQNLGPSDFLNPIATLTSPADAFNPLPLTIVNGTSPYPDFLGFDGAGDCDTPAVLDPKTNIVAFTIAAPLEHDSDVARVFNLAFTQPLGTEAAMNMPITIGIGAKCDPTSELDGETYDGLLGLQSPLDVALVPEGDPVQFADRNDNVGSTIPLKLDLLCDGNTLGPEDVDPKPMIVSLREVTRGPQSLVGINDSSNANPDDPRFVCGSNGCDYQLRTEQLVPGVYIVGIEMPDTRVYEAGFTLRP